ncbi:MAG: ATP-dependent helicase [Bacteroidetes bacterium]|nr:ATP-dependent helicase [Bacteroidota bacterium]
MKDANSFFEIELERMNEAQRLAVETTEGPVMVIAGPGTGKTQILAARIGYILQKSELQAFPENILCLTYTDAGAIAMRQRLIQFIGTDANKITILTFHAFCNQLIQQNIDLFGHEDMRMISPIEELLLLRKMIDSLEKDHPLKRYTGDVYYDVKRLLSLFKQMKKEDWSSEFISQKADEYLKEIIDNPEHYPQFYYKRKTKEFNVGDLKQKEFKAIEDQLTKLKAAANLSNIYGQMMADEKLYDFEDMILWVLNQLKQNDTFKEQIQERYLYILVDEFQDTNESQNEIIEHLCSHWGDESNIFVVGDDDQSIFRFQGANIQNIDAFTKSYKRTLQTIILKENYRSTQPILDAAASLISKNKERIIYQMSGVDKNLVSNSIANAEPVSIVELPNKSDEIVYIVQQIKKDIEQGIEPKNIAVIYRNNRQVEELSKYLDYSKVAFTLRKRTNILDEVFTQKIIFMLNYLIGESKSPFSHDDMLFKILQFDFWNIEDVNESARYILDWNSENQSKRDSKTPFRRYIQNKIKETKADLFSSNQSQVQEVVTILDKLIKAIDNHSAQECFEMLVYQTGMVKYILNHIDKVYLLEQLRSLFDHIIAETSRNTKMTLQEVLDNIQLMVHLGLSLEIERVIYKGEGITLTTAHSSKGLEYDSVYMMGNTKKEWEGGSNRGFSLPPNIFIRLSDANEDEEQRRLFYVAMTRAKTKLIISYYSESLEGKTQEPCMFINELLGDENKVLFHKQTVDESDALAFNLAVMQPPVNLPLPEMDNPLVKKFIENLKVSATQMSSYLACSREFYYNYILKVPVAKQKALVFGSAVHAAYESIFKKLKESNNEFLPVEYMISVFKAKMYQDEGAFSASDFKRYIEHGENIITNHYNHYQSSWNKIVTAEKGMRAVVYGGIPITGFIDKIEFEGNKAKVVDYKTGKPSNALDKFKKPQKVADISLAKKHEIYGGDYWRQAVFYKILMEHDAQKNNDWKFDGAEFDFIEPDSKTGDFIKVKVDITEEDEQFVSGLIQQVYKKIKNLEFDEPCGECSWCKMLQ